MGLAVGVGFLADMKRNDAEGFAWASGMFADVSGFLTRQGLPTWTEPEEVSLEGMRPHVSSFPYGFLHYLRRAYAHAVAYPDAVLSPLQGALSDEDWALIDDEGAMLSSHLICHSDAEGLYVPVAFADPLFADDGEGVPGGGMLGSSHGLLAELRIVAPRIGVTLEDGRLTDAEARRIHTGYADSVWEREHVVFLALWEAARLSTERSTAIVFH